MKVPVSYSIKSLFQRKISTAMTIASFALVVIVLLALLAMVQGVNATLISSGAKDLLFVINRNATTENQSLIPAKDIPVLSIYPEIKLDKKGQAVLSKEIVRTSYAEYGANKKIQVNFRGVNLPQALKVHYNMRLIKGSFFTPSSTEEVIVGQNIYDAMGLHVGDRFTAEGYPWRIVGVFSDNGSPFESEIWTSVNNMILGFDVHDFSSVWMVAQSPNQMSGLIDKINNNPNIFVSATSEKSYFAQGTVAAKGFQALTWFIAIVLSIGAIFSAINTMYASLADREGEIGVLRAIGFQARAVQWATLLETVIMALLGWMIASVLVFFLQGITFRTPLTGLGYVSFKVTVTPLLIITGFVFSLVMGVVGGWIPSRHAAQIPIIEALNR